ncbi:DUF4861 domain-containing protein [Arachidicoccus terrestris]|uniref:DUF4861 domain-containing protein n=1 Tax=Arachidicoccus terrestris TaxID=2875539 RepID=UPI001CC79225|nr:DUF4861 domain-containing protein [Arachidicoccus terrestris]UAY55880.1 DUF4861 domain-containing protein [Arachidicoccus terrestris]
MHKTLMAAAALLVLFSCAGNSDAQKNSELRLKNTMGVDRPEATVVLTRKQLEAKAGSLDNFYLRFAAGGSPLTAQYDDLDRDGKWDEVVLLCPMKASASVKIELQKTDTLPVFQGPSIAHARMKLKNEDQTFGESRPSVQMPDQNPPTDFSKKALPPYLTEGPGWENDKVAFRLYFDTRNNKDIYGKRVAGMVMDSVGANPGNSYHHLADWGMDILKVGSSLGAGALAFHYQKADGRDTLVRLGGKDIKGETYQLLSDGPLRASFLMTYPWQLAGKPVTVTEKISITAGKYDYTSEIEVKGEALPEDLKADMGFADFYKAQLDSIVTDQAKVVYSFGKQSENHDNLGMAILSTQPAGARIWSLGEKLTPVSDITSSYLMEVPVKAGVPVTFRFFAGWALTDSAFNSAAGFKAMLQQEADLLAHPIEVE